MRKIVVTGAAGFVGSYLVAKLIELVCHSKDEYTVVALARPFKDCSAEDRIIARLKAINPDINLEFLKVINSDLTKPSCGIDWATMSCLYGCDIIYHAAADTRFEKRWEQDVMATNVKGTENVLGLAKMFKSHVIYISTLYVCGQHDGIFREEPWPLKKQAARNPYERSKLEAESKVIKFCETNELPWIIIRPGIIVGHSQTGHTFVFNAFYTIARGLYQISERVKNVNSPIEKAAFWLSGIRQRTDNLYVPFTIPGKQNATLTVVPIDMVVDTIVDIVDHQSSRNQVFHLLPRDIHTCGWWLDKTTDLFNVRGVSFVDPQSFPPKRGWFKQVLKKIEKQINSYSREYGSYMNGEPRFDNSNCLALVDQHPARVDEAFVGRILEYAIKSEFQESGV